MFDLDLWREIFQSINMNRTRTVLSGFTVLFAILLFTILFGIANGLNNSFAESFNDDANNSIFIRTGRTSKAYKGMQAGRRIQIKNEDFDFIKDEFNDEVQYITARIYKNVTASFRSEQSAYDLRAVHPDHQFLEKSIMQEGRYINMGDLHNRTKVAVIGRLVEEDLFKKTTAIGKFINLNGISYKVVGIFSDEGSDNEERKIYIPVSTAQQVYGNNDYLDQINLTYNPNLTINQAIGFGNKLEEDLKDRFSVARNDQRAIRVFNMAQQNKNVNQMTTVLGVIVFIIGLGTLIAGIVGISNIMIFIVKERTKEIGIRKALGAKPSSIVSIILIESIIITSIAGYIGLILGVSILKLVGPSLKDYFITNPSVSSSLVFGATVILIIAGGIAGYVPAKKASRIKPIVALRND
ncbi:ABC transporter ATP-binding protein [Tamlana sedimentorum]|uniref:ABC transporter ATP-binding protein n=1 Tax=Neotamlana sedimentorum TaxID=1435349 RepID=A0A0D7WA40_9FLAO|nr:ABC transporter permease [Tamlana sedimentorum]KJD35508.1 ABC transporter ATP-binding protein [Tamlana sedimentorum]